MAGKKNEQSLFDVIVLPILFLIAVGDYVRQGLGFLSWLIISFYNIGKTIGSKIQKLKFPTIRFVYPKITLPSLSVPTISFPRLKLLKKFARVWPKRVHVREKVIYPPQPVLSDQIKSFIAGIIATFIFFVVPYNTYQWLVSLPNPELLSRRDLEVTTKIFDRNGILLYEVYADQNRTPVPLTQIPAYVVNATIAIEDQDFYNHQGFSLRAIARAIKETVINNRIQGGSTITQQLIKSALLTPEVKLSRKVKEILLAFWAERLYTKNQILEMYLNQVPYGGTAWGIEAASQTYFGKSVKDLTLAEAALLAGLPAAPTEYSPFGSHP